jgi:hypothetical protein
MDALCEQSQAKWAEIDDLADEIAVAAATADAAIHRLLKAIRRFDELKGWHVRAQRRARSG